VNRKQKPLVPNRDERWHQLRFNSRGTTRVNCAWCVRNSLIRTRTCPRPANGGRCRLNLLAFKP